MPKDKIIKKYISKFHNILWSISREIAILNFSLITSESIGILKTMTDFEIF